MGACWRPLEGFLWPLGLGASWMFLRGVLGASWGYRGGPQGQASQVFSFGAPLAARQVHGATGARNVREAPAGRRPAAVEGGSNILV